MVRRRAFSLIELLVVIAIIALLVSILLPALASARQSARNVACMGRLQQIGRAHATYQAENKHHLAILNGAKEQKQFPFRPLPDHCGMQAAGIIRAAEGLAAADLPNYFSSDGASINPRGVFVFEQHSHLMLTPYLGDNPRSPVFACPSDAPRLTWQKTPLSAMATAPYQPTKSPNRSRQGRDQLMWWAFSSSYQLMPSALFTDGWASGGQPHHYYHQFTAHDTYELTRKGSDTVVNRRIDDVRFPSQKVAVADSQQRHHGSRDLFYAYPEAVLPLLFWDASVRAHKTKDANIGWNPPRHGEDVRGPAPGHGATEITYIPDTGFESPTLSGQSTEKGLLGYYRWTRGGLEGIDFGGREIKTWQ